MKMNTASASEATEAGSRPSATPVWEMCRQATRAPAR